MRLITSDNVATSCGTARCDVEEGWTLAPSALEYLRRNRVRFAGEEIAARGRRGGGSNLAVITVEGIDKPGIIASRRRRDRPPARQHHGPLADHPGRRLRHGHWSWTCAARPATTRFAGAGPGGRGDRHGDLRPPVLRLRGHAPHLADATGAAGPATRTQGEHDGTRLAGHGRDPRERRDGRPRPPGHPDRHAGRGPAWLPHARRTSCGG